WHVTFLVNSVSHRWGYRNYPSPDNSRNCWWVALLTFGEGWHNNHHHRPRCAAHGHRWFEIDTTYALIRLLERLGLAPQVVHPPRRGPLPAVGFCCSLSVPASDSTGQCLPGLVPVPGRHALRGHGADIGRQRLVLHAGAAGRQRRTLRRAQEVRPTQPPRTDLDLHPELVVRAFGNPVSEIAMLGL